MNNNVNPCFYRARAVPHALKVKVEQALQQLMDQKVIEPVAMSDWAAPIVPVLKPDGSIRICGDYKITINKAAKQDVYPLPRVEDLFATLAGGKSFTKLDLAHAYTQTNHLNNMLPSTPTRDCLDTTDYHSEFRQHLQYFKE